MTIRSGLRPTRMIGRLAVDRSRHAYLGVVGQRQQFAVAPAGGIAATTREDGLGVSVISCWEVAKLVEKARLQLSAGLSDWIDAALLYPGIHLLPLTPQIAVESTQLPGEFHNDPADPMIVATARTHDVPLLTADARIRAYEHVATAE
jgi:PIN domain nuclease of toxin-antitoxin system